MYRDPLANGLLYGLPDHVLDKLPFSPKHRSSRCGKSQSLRSYNTHFKDTALASRAITCRLPDSLVFKAIHLLAPTYMTDLL